MGATWAGRLAGFLALTLVPLSTRSEPPAHEAADAPKTAATTVKPGPEPTSAPATPDALRAEAAKARADATTRLKPLAETPEKSSGPSPALSKSLREILEDRLKWLDAWEEAVKQRHEAEHPTPSPERQSVEAKGDLEHVKTLLDEAAKNPEALLPSAFRASKTAAPATEPVLAEMKEAIDAGQTELKEWFEKVEKLKGDTSQPAQGRVAALRAERDKIHQRVATLNARRNERESAVSAAKSPGDRAIALERLINFQWEARAEQERLAGVEAKISLEGKLAALSAAQVQVAAAHLQLAKKALDQMQERYHAAADRRERALKRAAAEEALRAAKANDPIERYRAKRTAELLELEAQVTKSKNARATSPFPSLEEERKLADDAETDFANIKKLLDDGRVSHLDALRLNNDFRRIGPERERLVGRDLSAAANQVALCENALSGVELALVSDSRDDRFEFDALLERLPKTRYAEATAVFDELEAKHAKLLAEHRLVLVDLAARAEQTHDQVLRRLQILDDQYGFIRTHLILVRDREPIGLVTLKQAEREVARLGKGLARLALELGDRSLWGRISVEFVVGALALAALPWPLYRARRFGTRSLGTTLRPVRSLLAGIGTSAAWPAYVGLLAYTARQAPWPRSVALLASSVLAVFALAALALALSRRLLGTSGWAENVLRVPPIATRQFRLVVLALTAGAVAFLLPEQLLSLGLLTPGGRPLSAPSLCRFFELAFEVVVLLVAYRLTRAKSGLVAWGLEAPERFGWLNRHRRLLGWCLPLAIGGVIALDACGYSFTARRLAIGACQFVLVGLLCWVVHRLILRAIDHQAWRWIRIGHVRSDQEETDDSGQPRDLAGRLRRLTGYVIPLLGVLLCAWLWDIDLALFRSLGEQVVFAAGKETPPLTLGNLTQAVLFLLLTTAAWRHLSTFFAVAVFPRMPDDPGVRFAVLTLCRYAVLGVGVLAALAAVHLGPAQIGMVLAALGVGLGFGLQEIVSNFVCGIILLLERPIRVGDVVTVSGMNGKVDRINIRATTIINGDNQSIIVPNRAFITGDLINWTLKDKIVRASIRVKVAQGTDPDRVTDLLLTIAREDDDVLRNPVPASLMEDFSDSALAFVLHVHVPDPSLSGRVRHRLMTQIQKRFREAGIEIPLPAHELLVKSASEGSLSNDPAPVTFLRPDPPAEQPPAPHWNAPAQPVAEVEECRRGVDE